MNSDSKAKIIVFGGVSVLICSLFAAIGLWTDRNLEYFLTMWKGEAVDVPFWISFAISIVLNAVIIGFNIMAELLRLVL